MTIKKESAANTINEQSKLIGIDIPIIEQDSKMLISAILLHKKLQTSTKFSTWMPRRIAEYGFLENEDFYPNLGKSTGGRQAKDFLLSMDMAKELAMVEKNLVGRQIRRYFIEIEKRYRDWIGFILPRLEISYDLFGQQEGYKYNDLLKACGASLKSGSKSARVRKNKQDFFRWRAAA